MARISARFLAKGLTAPANTFVTISYKDWSWSTHNDFSQKRMKWWLLYRLGIWYFFFPQRVELQCTTVHELIRFFMLFPMIPQLPHFSEVLARHRHLKVAGRAYSYDLAEIVERNLLNLEIIVKAGGMDTRRLMSRLLMWGIRFWGQKYHNLAGLWTASALNEHFDSQPPIFPILQGFLGIKIIFFSRSSIKRLDNT